MKVGFVGWRGMVGQVVMERIKAYPWPANMVWTYYSQSYQGIDLGLGQSAIKSSLDVSSLVQQDVILTCQGSEYSHQMYPELKKAGYQGYWIDASSAFRNAPETTLLLDPLNLNSIQAALHDGKKIFSGANCTVSLMLLALKGLLDLDLIEWISSMTYQAASGAGASQLKELIQQSQQVSSLYAPQEEALKLEQKINEILLSPDLPQESLGYPLSFNVLPWIDSLMESGETREEWKGYVEGNKILNKKNPLPIDGICVRVPVLRCHAQALTLKLKKNLTIDEIQKILGQAHPWIKIVPNTKEATLNHLIPSRVTGGLTIAVGRIKKLKMGEEYVSLFTIGDQLLWGAAEPLVRFLHLLSQR